jgi:hypothetical protein
LSLFDPLFKGFLGGLTRLALQRHDFAGDELNEPGACFGQVFYLLGVIMAMVLLFLLRLFIAAIVIDFFHRLIICDLGAHPKYPDGLGGALLILKDLPHVLGLAQVGEEHGRILGMLVVLRGLDQRGFQAVHDLKVAAIDQIHGVREDLKTNRIDLLPKVLHFAKVLFIVRLEVLRVARLNE